MGKSQGLPWVPKTSSDPHVYTREQTATLSSPLARKALLLLPEEGVKATQFVSCSFSTHLCRNVPRGYLLF